VVQASGADTTAWTTGTAPPGTLAEGIIVQWETEVTAGNSGDAFLQVRIGDATPAAYEVRVTVTPTAIVLRDMVAGADVASVTTPAGTSGVIIRVALLREGGGAPGNDGRVKAWYTTELTGGDREWIQIGSSSTLSVSGGATTARVQWGVLAGASTCRFKQAHYVSDDYTGDQLVDQVNPHDLPGRNFAASPSWVDGGLLLRAKDGPAYRNDEWLVSTAYDWGVEHVNAGVSPSPRRGWRSTTDDSDVEIAWEVTATNAQAAPFLGECVGVYLGGINFRDWSLMGRNAAGSWVTILTGSSAQGQTGLSFLRQGDVVLPDATVATSAEDYFPFNILEGSYFKYKVQQGEAGLVDVVRRIRGNSEGAWQGSAGATKRVSILLEDTTSSDQTSSNAGEIWSKEAFACRSDATRYTAYKLKIPAQVTCEGYFIVGVAVIGHCALLARQYSWGRAQAMSPNTELVTGRAGSRRARALGTPRRSVEMAWMEGVDVAPTGGTAPAPPYVKSAIGGSPAATPADTPLLVAGLVDRLRGSRDPVVYLPSLPRAAATNVEVQLVSRQAMLYGRVVSESVSLETVIGDELAGGGEGEVLRLAGLVIEEEL
ncbi:MAG: hypothetical protein FJ102_22465, partial [Deltaproteobacteria bacterium]|nr:hypothetical protein [Deltaproteobacteria bacterium]